MKKALLLVILISAFATFSFAANGADNGESELRWAGLDTIVYGWPNLNSEGQITSIQGISILGYTWKNYFSPVEPEKVNYYWEIGANLLLLGLNAGVGITYPISMEDSSFNYLFLSGYVNVAWGVFTALIPIPYPGIGIALIF